VIEKTTLNGIVTVPQPTTVPVKLPVPGGSYFFIAPIGYYRCEHF
jgi:hypothetical protein